jgi:septal ring factor EnvC (AmiA/AmiB activator)
MRQPRLKSHVSLIGNARLRERIEELENEIRLLRQTISSYTTTDRALNDMVRAQEAKIKKLEDENLWLRTEPRRFLGVIRAKLEDVLKDIPPE